VYVDSNSDGKQSFSQQIQSLQSETDHLCSYIRMASLVSVKKLIRLMQDRHAVRPNLQSTEVSLVNIAAQDEKYQSYVIQQLNDCDAIRYMLMKSVDSGALVDYYLKEGNYSLVSSIIDKWHQQFLNLRSKFNLGYTSLDIILNNKQSFFHDSWLCSITKSILPLIVLAVISYVVLIQIFTMIRLITWITDLFIPSTSTLHQQQQQQQPSIENGLSKNSITQHHVDNTNSELRRRQQILSPEANQNISIQNNSNLATVIAVNSQRIKKDKMDSLAHYFLCINYNCNRILSCYNSASFISIQLVSCCY